MKKFTMVGLIIAAIMAGAGILFCGISAMTGGYRTAKEIARNGEIVNGNWHISRDGIYYNDDDDWDDDWDDEGSSDVVASEEQLETNGTVSGEIMEFAVGEIENLQFDIGAAELTFEENSDSEHIRVELLRGKKKYYACNLEDGTLTVEYGKNMKGISVNGNHAVLKIQIPAGLTVSDIDMNIGACDAKILVDDITCKNLNMNVGAGALTAEGFTVNEKMNIDVGAGEIIIKGGVYEDVNVECGVGNFEMKGSVNRNLLAECGMGNMELELYGNENDYNYELECDMGNLAVNGRSYASISGNHSITNDGAKGTIELSCGMGNLELDFE